MRTRTIVCTAAIALVGALVACGDSDPPLGFDGPEVAAAECTRGDKEACTCPDGKASTKTCSSAGRFLECSCEPTPAVCGNGTCDTGETCKTCPQDCGPCPTCAGAPSCSTGANAPSQLKTESSLDVKLEAMDKAQILARITRDAERGSPGLLALADAALGTGGSPAVVRLRAALSRTPALRASLEKHLARPQVASALSRGRDAHAARLAEAARATAAPAMPSTMAGDAGGLADASFGDGGPDAGGVPCEPARLRLRVSKVTVSEEDDDFANDIVYCSIAAESPGGSEMRITPKTPNLDEGDSFTFGGEGAFWGQKAPRDPQGDLTVRYDCFEEDSNNGYGDFVKAAGEIIADQAGERLPEGYGWVSTVIDLAARYLPSLLALDGDDHLFIATQTIPRAKHLELTNGGTWSVRRKGKHFGSDWDWTLKVEAWGCVENGQLR